MAKETTTDRKEVGARIRAARAGMTAKDLAKKAGMSAGYLSDVERGVSAISSEKLLSLAGHLGVSIEYLLTGSDGGVRNTPSPDIQVPLALSEAAEELNLSFNQTMRLLRARRTLRAKRTTDGTDRDLDRGGWIRFFKKVKDFMEE